MGNGSGTASRQLAPAITGADRSDTDAPVMEQWVAEISDVTGSIRNQADRLRGHTDRLFGSVPRDEEDREEKGPVAEVQPGYDLIGRAIMQLHRAKDKLLEEVERLEGHRLV